MHVYTFESVPREGTLCTLYIYLYITMYIIFKNTVYGREGDKGVI